VNVCVGVRASRIFQNGSVGAANGILRFEIERDGTNLRAVTDVG
jgi:hypothetical protein